MAPHGVFKCKGDDNWVAIACRDERDWEALRSVIDDLPELGEKRFSTLDGRVEHQDDLEALLRAWCTPKIRFDIARDLQAVGVPAAAVTRPAERIDGDVATQAWGLWPAVEHAAMGGVRVDGQPVHFSKTDWSIEHGGPTLGQHNNYVFGDLLGLSAADIDQLRDDGVI